MKKCYGVLLAVSSLPSKYGIGEFNEYAYEFIDLLYTSGAKIWQILPLNPLGFGNSPYQSVCGSAIDPIYISLDKLVAEGYLENVTIVKPNFDETKVQYGEVREFKEFYLKKAFLQRNLVKEKDFDKFLIENKWVEDYAHFMVLLNVNDNKIWNEWNIEDRDAAYNKNYDYSSSKDDVEYYEWVEYIAYKQYLEIKQYANSKGIAIMGDLPFYVGENSVDIWANQDDFLLDEDGKPTDVAGVPPDYFSKTGQRWGNPIYDWEYMKNDNFGFLLNRVKKSAKLYNFLRIDHFRAFDTYYKIPVSCPTAEVGTWENAYGDEFLSLLLKEKLDVKIIAEDLGVLFPSVLKLRDKYKLPGMNVLHFTFFDKGFKVKQNQVVYTGTHDNQTSISWYESLSKKEKAAFKARMKRRELDNLPINLELVGYAFSLSCSYAIIPVQDIIGLSDEQGRMNTPGTIGNPNWQFKLKDFKKLKVDIAKVKRLAKKYGRI